MIAEYLDCMDVDDDFLALAAARHIKLEYISNVRTTIISGTPSVVAKEIIDMAAAATIARRQVKLGPGVAIVKGT